MKKVIVFIFVLVALTTVGQNMKLISYTASNGKEYKVGSKVYLGTGTKDDQSFGHIHQYSPHYRVTTQLIYREKRLLTLGGTTKN